MPQPVDKETLGPAASVIHSAAPQGNDLQSYTTSSDSPPLQPPPYTATCPTKTQNSTKPSTTSPLQHYKTMADETPNQNNPQIVPLDRLDNTERGNFNLASLHRLDRLDRLDHIERVERMERIERIGQEDRRNRRDRNYFIFGIFLVVMGLIVYFRNSRSTPVA